MIYLISGCGAPNFGDEIIAHHWLGFISRNCSNEPIVLETTSVNPENLAHTITQKHVQPTNTLRTIARENLDFDFWEQLKRGWLYGLQANLPTKLAYKLQRRTLQILVA